MADKLHLSNNFWRVLRTHQAPQKASGGNFKKREKERKEKTVGVSYSGRRGEGPRSGLRQITERKKRPALILKTSARP